MAGAARPRPFDQLHRHREVPRRDAVRLEEHDVIVGRAARKLAGDDLLQLVHLEPVEHAGFDRLDQVGRLPPRRLAESQQTKLARSSDDVVELARAGPVRADRADERPRPQPLAAQHRVARSRDRDDDVALGSVAAVLARLGVDQLAERGEPLGRPAPGDDALDRRHGGEDRVHLRRRLAAAADHAQARRARAGEVLRGHTARRAGADAAQPIGLEHGHERAVLVREQADDELDPAPVPA